MLKIPGQNLIFTYSDTAKAYIISDEKGHSSILTVTAPDKTVLRAKTDYEIVTDDYSNNENVGSAAFTIQGKGQYCGTKVVKFSIVRRIFIWWKDLFD